MAIEVTCGGCQKVYELADRLAGQQVRCPNCSSVIQVPTAAAVEEAKRPSRAPGPPRERSAATPTGPAPAAPSVPSRKTPAQPSDSAILGSQQEDPLGRFHARHDHDLHVPVWVWFVLAGVVLFGALAWAIWQSLPEETKKKKDQPNVPANVSEEAIKQPDDAEPEPLPNRPSDPVAIAEFQAEVRKGVVRILVQDGRGKTIAESTGLILDPQGLVVTTYHSVREGHAAEIELDAGVTVAALGYRAVRPDLDLAILQFKPSGEEPDEKPKMFLKGNPKEGTEVLALYRGDDRKPVFISGQVVRTVATNNLPAPEQAFVRKLGGVTNHLWIEHDATMPSGRVGGPVVGYDGHVLGINSWIAGNKTYALHARHVAEALRKGERFEQVQPMSHHRSSRTRPDTFEPDAP